MSVKELDCSVEPVRSFAYWDPADLDVHFSGLLMSVEPGASTQLRFGVFEVDLRAGDIRKRGLRVRLRGRPFDLLAILLEGKGEVVTREELKRRLWTADTYVDFDHGLNAAVNKLREVLGDSADSPRYVETIPRKGYRFIAPVETIARTSAPSLSVPPAGPTPSNHYLAFDKPTVELTGAPSTLPVPMNRLAPENPETLVAVEHSVRENRAEAAPGPRPSTGPAPDGRWTRWLPPRRLAVSGVALLSMSVAIAASYLALTPRSIPAGTTDHRLMLAVLPFENLSDDPNQEYFSDGVTQEIIARLGAWEPSKLGVIARTTMMQYKHARKDVGQIGRELEVEYVLEGSVRRSADKVRLTAQLIRVDGETTLWAEIYEGDSADIQQIQTEVAVQVARLLSLRIRP